MGRNLVWLLAAVLFASSQLCGGVLPEASETGLASYYAEKYHGRTTASGETFDRREMTAAHRTLPFGTKVRVTHLGNNRSVTVRINDRGPFIAGRVIDVSPAAADELQMRRAGLAKVRVEVVQPAS